ncbi:MAG: hypothetical protein Q8O67_21800 [Deltaproteobacteria bacterium]|nr:hypothetical protein [Deltaproteobacteria bacterium]
MVASTVTIEDVPVVDDGDACHAMPSSGAVTQGVLMRAVAPLLIDLEALDASGDVLGRGAGYVFGPVFGVTQPHHIEGLGELTKVARASAGQFHVDEARLELVDVGAPPFGLSVAVSAMQLHLDVDPALLFFPGIGVGLGGSVGAHWRI